MSRLALSPAAARLPRLALLVMATLATPAAATSSASAAGPGLDAAVGVSFSVSPDGDDDAPGTPQRPFATVRRALEAARDTRRAGLAGPPRIEILLAPGTHYLDAPLVIGPELGSEREDTPLVIRSSGDERAVLSGGRRLELEWKPYRGEILQARVPPDVVSDQLFVNGERLPMARYPNLDPKVRHFGGYAKDAFSRERAARWADPRGGYMHAMHRSMWGDFHYVIRGKKPDGELDYEGGWQNNRRYGMHARYRMVENIFEELDAPGEWYLDAEERTLYLWPPAGVDIARARVEAVRLRHLIEVRGTVERPVRHVRVEGLVLRHAARTFMDNREPLLRSDWTTYRGGAVLVTGAEDVTFERCEFDRVGGNALFVSGYARRVTLRRSWVHRAGASGVAFVGDPEAVRSPLFEYSERQTWAGLDREPGPKSESYPRDCLVEDCLFFRTGRVEKQTAAVQISMSRGITVRHVTVHDLPRAGINVSEGTWGGHRIEHCDVFDTVKETGDHGSFNSWGRDRFWGLKDLDLNREDVWREHSHVPLLDVVEPNVLHHNRWRCDHGWDIDLDDGSTRYVLTENLCLNGGIKLREGFYRVCENNIMVNNSFHPHVWYRHSQDVFQRNIVFGAYRPIRVPKPWGKVCDRTLWHRPGASIEPATKLGEQSGRDEHSIVGDAMFVDPASGDYRVRPESEAARRIGFRSFRTDDFGVVSPELRARAGAPRLPVPGGGDDEAEAAARRRRDVRSWLGVRVRDVVGLGDRSAFGLEDASGVIVVEAPAGSAGAAAGLRAGDVITALAGEKVPDASTLLERFGKLPPGEPTKLTVVREQRAVPISITRTERS